MIVIFIIQILVLTDDDGNSYDTTGLNEDTAQITMDLIDSVQDIRLTTTNLSGFNSTFAVETGNSMVDIS